MTGRRANQLRYGANEDSLTFRTPNRIRTGVSAVKGRRPRPLDDRGGLYVCCPFLTVAGWWNSISLEESCRSLQNQRGCVLAHRKGGGVGCAVGPVGV